MTPDLENRWLRFGLETNPYFAEALHSTTRGPRPITLFQGRDKQTRELGETIVSEVCSLNLVEAPAGVGKSTFVHHVKHVLGRRYFAPPNEVGVQSGVTPERLLLGVLDAVVRHASDLAPDAKWEKEFPAIATARRMAMAVQSVGWDLAVGVNLSGAGGSVGVGRSASTAPPILGPILSPAFFQDLVADLLRLKGRDAAGVVFHVNNLDTALREDPSKVRTLFSDLRDHFTVPGSHWVFVGPPGLRAEAVAPERRVLPFVKSWIELDRLPLSDVEKLLQRRYEHYAIPGGPGIPPTEPGVVKLLYDRFGGDLRGMLNALTIAHRHYDPLDVAPMPEAFGRELLERYYLQHLTEVLSPKTLQVLKFLVKRGDQEYVQDAVKSIERDQANRSRRFAELEQWDAVRLVRREALKKVYTFGGPARLAFGV